MYWWWCEYDAKIILDDILVMMFMHVDDVKMMMMMMGDVYVMEIMIMECDEDQIDVDEKQDDDVDDVGLDVIYAIFIYISYLS